MLEIYECSTNFKDFVEKIYLKHFGMGKKFSEIIIDQDVLLLDQEKYYVEDINKYMEFMKYKPLEDKKLIVINGFEKFDIRSQNKFLLSFEESKFIHVLNVCNLNKVLPTIRSRAIMYENTFKKNSFENFPKRYENVLQIIQREVKDEDLFSDYIKFYEYFKNEKYQKAYLYLTIKMIDYNEKLIYELIEYCGYEMKLDDLLDLQGRLFYNINRKLQIESFLVNLY